MPDQAIRELPRIAFLYGDPALAEHVREAMAGCVEIAYASSVEGFDVASLADARVVAALVNVDNADWLDDVQARLNAVGIPVVFNDPDISRGLEGWDRARWLRHLTAKLRGSKDFDPPRPEPLPEVTATAFAVDAAASGSAVAPASAAVDTPAAGEPPQPATAVVARPLSTREIETMTADFAGASGDAATATTPDEDFLDVDTEALSAMIDAHLAQPVASAEAGADEAWAIAEATQGRSDSAAPGGIEGQPDTRIAEQHDPASTTIAGDPGADLQDGIPALGDWQLLDPDSTSNPTGTTAERKRTAPSLPDDFAGLELVPMDVVASPRLHAEPIERWLDDTVPKAKAKAKPKAKAKHKGEKA